jgi:hypothetical protein
MLSERLEKRSSMSVREDGVSFSGMVHVGVEDAASAGSVGALLGPIEGVGGWIDGHTNAEVEWVTGVIGISWIADLDEGLFVGTVETAAVDAQASPVGEHR